MPTTVNDDAVKAAEARLREIEAGIETGQTRYRELRQKRGALVAAGKDSAAVKRELEAANTELEALEDALPHARRAVERAQDAARAAAADGVRERFERHKARRLELAEQAEEQAEALRATLSELRESAMAMFSADRELRNLGSSPTRHPDRLQGSQHVVNWLYGRFGPLLPGLVVPNAGSDTRSLRVLEADQISKAGG